MIRLKMIMVLLQVTIILKKKAIVMKKNIFEKKKDYFDLFYYWIENDTIDFTKIDDDYKFIVYKLSYSD